MVIMFLKVMILIAVTLKADLLLFSHFVDNKRKSYSDMGVLFLFL